MNLDDLELLERTTTEMVVQAISDYRDQAAVIFREETDQPQDIAEDILREAMDLMGMAGFHERLYGNVDYKRAIYVFVPEAYPVALMLDAKAEKGNGSATLQMSQTSMEVMYTKQNGDTVHEHGKLGYTLERGGRTLHVVTIVAKYLYSETDGARTLERIIIACVPNGRLQDRYNPGPQDTIWRAGRHAPTLGEDFRVRLAYKRLRDKAPWRVRDIQINHRWDSES